MGKDDWYRNSEWNDSIASAYRSKLSKARSMRPQYITIQASQLVSRYPEVALGLIDEYFESYEDFVVPSAYCTRAEAYISLNHIDLAITSYKNALQWEATHPNYLTNARIDLPILIADKKIEDEYDYALEILTERFKSSDHLWPSMRYFWNGCYALISYERGELSEAREFAERALRAAAETESPFRYHRSMGLVKDTSDDFGQRVKRIARPSALRALLRLVTKR
jgi:tetratricopeptide (TPR) repeat protein